MVLGPHALAKRGGVVQMAARHPTIAPRISDTENQHHKHFILACKTQEIVIQTNPILQDKC